MKKINAALEFRPYRYKKSLMEFFCPLCRTKRAFNSSPRLRAFHYLQILLISTGVVALFFPLMGGKGLFLIFVVWALYEFAIRLNFKREIPCPHCGFDASSYQRDVLEARQKVATFWHAKGYPSQEEGADMQTGADLTGEAMGDNGLLAPKKTAPAQRQL